MTIKTIKEKNISKKSIKLKSRYSTIFYKYFCFYLIKKEYIISIEDINKLSNTNYKQFSDLKRFIIEKIIKEINLNTELNIDYEVIKKVRKVEKIKFLISKKRKDFNLEKNIKPPTLNDVKKYCLKRKNNVSYELFWNFYEKKNWMSDGKRIKDWRFLILIWEQNLKIKEKIEQKEENNNNFKIPTLKEIEIYLIENNIHNINAEKFFNYYESKNWFINKNKITTWKYYLNIWLKNSKTDNNNISSINKINNEKIKKNEEINHMKFIKPTIEEIQNHLKEKSIKNIDAEEFWNFYEMKDWFVGKNKMKNWKCAITVWNKRIEKETINNINKKIKCAQDILNLTHEERIARHKVKHNYSSDHFC